MLKYKKNHDLVLNKIMKTLTVSSIVLILATNLWIT